MRATRVYGGPWQEFRAFMASLLIGWAMKVHFRMTMDMAADLADLEGAKTRPPA